MCGLCFVLRKDGRPARKQLLKTYENQKTRGQLGFGYVAFSKGEIEDVKRSSEESDIYNSLREVVSEGIMFHHRFPTSTPNFKEGAHPIYVSSPRLQFDYYVIHNGVITNCDNLKRQHEIKGYKYTTEMIKHEVWKTRDETYTCVTDIVKFNDSESLAIELAEGIETLSPKIEAFGSIAFICVQATKDNGNDVVKINNIFFGRNTNPLNLEVNDHYIKLSSSGSGKEIVSHQLYCYNQTSGEISQRDCQFGFDYSKWKREDDDDGYGYNWRGKTKTLLPEKVDQKEMREIDEIKRLKAIKEKEKLEKEIEEDYYSEIDKKHSGKDGQYGDDFLTGEETLEELQQLLAWADKEYEEFFHLGDEAGMEESYKITVEIEDAIEDWKFNNSLDQMNIDDVMGTTREAKNIYDQDNKDNPNK